MKILFLNAYFYPEQIAFTHLEKDLIQALCNDGNEIFVLCPVPTRGISTGIYKKYKHIRKETMYGGRVHVKRFWTPREGRNPVARAVRYVWCTVREYQLAGIWEEIDLVFACSTPPIQGVLGGMAAKKLSRRYKKKIPFVYGLQDIFPDSMCNANMAKEGGLLWRIGRRLEDYTYRNSRQIIVISEGFKKNIQRKGVEEKKISLISNWINLEGVKPVEREHNALVRELGINQNDFVVVYAGNFGVMQGAEIILDVAGRLQEIEELKFAVWGSGPYFQEFCEKAQVLGYRNLIVNSLLPQERVSEVYSLGDVSLIICRPGTGMAGLPSKIWSIMACNTPIIASFDDESDLAYIIKESGAGLCVEPGSVSALCSAVYHAYCERSRKGDNPNNLRKYVEEHASKDICPIRYVEVFRKAVEDGDHSYE